MTMSDSYNIGRILAQNLRAALTTKQMRKDVLSQRSGVSMRMIDYILKQERVASIDKVASLAKSLNMSVESLLSDKPQKLTNESGLDVEILTDLITQLESHRLSARQRAQIIAAHYPQIAQGKPADLEPSLRLVINNN